MARPVAKAFTLVELLVTIGIIAVLLGLLFPVVGKLRENANAASTSQSISTLQAAIQQYWTTFNAYPGPVPIGGFGGIYTVQAPLPATPSSSEELVLALRGGLTLNVGSKVLGFNLNDVGRGTLSLNPGNPKRYVDFGGVDYQDFNSNTLPEFKDAFPDPMPIHYVRAITAGTGTTYAGLGTIGEGASPLYPAPYGLKFGKDGDDDDSAADFANVNAYLIDPANPTSYRNKDSYILVAAGKDRIFGTKDDITNFGRPGE
jgi:prepilin-type N-terminal cleavage/methylation domain-containing protein